MIDESIAVICIFGSVARNSQDRNSDKDVLLIGASRARASKIIGDWAAAGWSVAFYTPQRLENMARAGSLFIQHLKQDGIIEHDSTGFMSDLLRTFAPKVSYVDDLMRSEPLVRPADRNPIDRDQAYMLADVLYVYVRNACILSLATNGLYEFDYNNLIDKYAEQVNLGPLEVAILKRLRNLKVEYRSRNLYRHNIIEIFEESKILVSMIFDLALKKQPAASSIRYFDMPYATLRDAEARLLSNFTVHDLDEGHVADDFVELWRVITDPRPYSWAIKQFGINSVWLWNRALSSSSIKTGT